MNVKLKISGECDAVETFARHVDENFLAVISQIRESDQGGCYSFATIRLDDK